MSYEGQRAREKAERTIAVRDSKLSTEGLSVTLAKPLLLKKTLLSSV